MSDLGDRVIEVSRLAGGLAHEIRNPLSTLLLNLRLLEEDLNVGLDERSDTLRRASRRISTVRAEAERLQAMLDDFLLLVTPLSIRRQPVELVGLVREVVGFFEPQAVAAGAALHTDFPAEPIEVDVDPHLLKQGIVNLLLNALEALEGRGRIDIALRRVGGEAQVVIRDDGVGMPPDVVAKVTQAFYSTKPNGTGLGLSVTQRMLEAHGGGLDVASAPGAGSTFTLRLPVGDGDRG